MPTPAALQEVWVDVLGTDPGPDGNFFAWGGDSVLVARLCRELSRRLGVRVPVKAVFDHPTLGGLAAYVRSLPTPDGPTPAALEHPAISRHELTAGQQRLWLHQKLYPTSTAYTVPLVLTLTGEVDEWALAEALSDVVARHEPLRTTYDDPTGLGRPEAVVHPPAPVTLETFDVDSDDAGEAVVAAAMTRPFDLETSRPVRCVLVRRSSDTVWLVLLVHHIATDGDSQQLLLDELGERYAARTHRVGAPSRTAPLPPMQPTYAEATRADVRSPEAEREAVARTMQRLAGAVPAGPPLEPPLRRPLQTTAPTGEDTVAPAGRRSSRFLGPAATGRLRELARSEQITTFPVLLGLCGESLSRWSGQQRVAVGYPATVRDPTRADAVIGFFVDTRIAAVDLQAEPSLVTLSGRVDADLRAAREDAAPVDRVVAGRPDSLDRAPFRVWFNHLGGGLRAPALPHLATSVRTPSAAPAIFDLNLYITDHDDDVEVTLVVDPSRCDGAWADELLAQYVSLVQRATAQPDAPVRSLQVRGAEHAAVPTAVADLPAADDGALGDAEVWRRWHSHAQQRPDAVALTHADGLLTWRTLAEAVDRLRARLAESGVSAGTTVAVQVRRGAALVVVPLAVWQVGARLLMLDPQHPAAHRQARASACGATVLVHDDCAADLGLAGEVAIAPDLEPTVQRRLPDTGPGAELAAGSLPASTARYVAFTSGSTGHPVAVASDLSPVAHFLQWYSTQWQIGPDDRVAVLAGSSHDPLLREVLLGPWTGAGTCVPAPATHADPEALGAWLRAEQVSVAHLTPPLARLLTATAPVGDRLRLVTLAGAPLTATDVRALQRWAPRAVVVNGYGTTETPQLVSWSLPTSDRVPDLGRGAPGSQLLVLAADGTPCEAGRLGSIVVRSRHLARAADGTELPGLTDDDSPGLRRFRTGDAGYRRLDGSVVFVGRADGVVDVRGHRVHPAETDRVLQAVPGVTASATVPRPGPDGTVLISYVVAPGARAASLRAAVAAQLPDVSVPSSVVLLDALPLTPNGKVDGRALPELSPGPSAGSSPATGPARVPTTADPVVATISRAWSAVLGVDGIDPDESFFDLGGNSLTMVRLHQALRRELPEAVPLLVLYENPTVHGLAGWLSGRQGGAVLARASLSTRDQQRDRRREARRAVRSQEVPTP